MPESRIDTYSSTGPVWTGEHVARPHGVLVAPARDASLEEPTGFFEVDWSSAVDEAPDDEGGIWSLDDGDVLALTMVSGADERIPAREVAQPAALIIDRQPMTASVISERPDASVRFMTPKQST